MSRIYEFPPEVENVQSKDVQTNALPEFERKREKQHGIKVKNQPRRVIDCFARSDRYG